MLKTSLKYIDLFIPNQLKENKDELVKTRYLIVLIGFSVFSVLFSFCLKSLGLLDNVFNHAIGVAYSIVPFVLLWATKKLKVVVHVFAIMALLNLNLTLVASGGLLSSALGWFSIFPILMLIMLGFKDALAWTFIMLVNLVVAFIFYNNQLPSDISISEYYFNHTLIVILSCFFVYLFWNSQKGLINKLKKQQLILEAKNELLESQTKELNKTRLALTNTNNTLAIKNDQLNISQMDLIESNQALQRYAHTVSHDLKEPLRSMNSFTQLLHRHYQKKDLIDERGQEYFDFILSSTSNMNKLIHDLLLFSKSSFKKKNFNLIDLNRILLTVKQNLNNQIHLVDVEIICSNLPTIYGMEIPMSQLFQNIISNAIKFKKPNTKSIIKISHEENETEWIISIKDNGIGIHENDSSKIFQEFHKIHHKTEFEGQGIGLSTCQKIIKQHEGHIWLESELGVGTTFYFSLPKSIEGNSVSKINGELIQFNPN